MTPARPGRKAIVGGRYVLAEPLGVGGMGTVWLGRSIGALGFERVVAIKRLHPHVAAGPHAIRRFVAEARATSSVRHTNVVPTIDVVADGAEVFLVMDYVAGESLAKLCPRDRSEAPPAAIAAAVVVGLLDGLHAVHETTRTDVARGLVHGDVSPDNVLVGADGIARVLDFGLAEPEDGGTRSQVFGKLAYVAPERLERAKATRQSDIYSASVVLWELLTGRALFTGASADAVVHEVLVGLVDPPSAHAPELTPAIDALVLHGLDPDPRKRFATAHEMARALEAAIHPALPSVVADWVRAHAGAALTGRAERVAAVSNETATDASTAVVARDRVPLLAPPSSSAAIVAPTAPMSTREEPPAPHVHSDVRSDRLAVGSKRRRDRRVLVAVGATALIAVGWGWRASQPSAPLLHARVSGEDAPPAEAPAVNDPRIEPVLVSPPLAPVDAELPATVTRCDAATCAPPHERSPATRTRATPPRAATPESCRRYDAREGVFRYDPECLVRQGRP